MIQHSHIYHGFPKLFAVREFLNYRCEDAWLYTVVVVVNFLYVCKSLFR